MTTVELATSLSFGSNLSSTYLRRKFWLAKLFGLFVLDCKIFNKDHICQIYNINLFRFSIVNLSLPLQPSEGLYYLTNYEVCQIELASPTWLGWLVRVAGTVLGCDAKYWLRRHFPSLLAKDGLMKRKVLDSSPRYVPRALPLFHQNNINIRS